MPAGRDDKMKALGVPGVTDPGFVEWRRQQETERSAADREFLRNLGIKSRQELVMPAERGDPLRARDVHEPMSVFELAGAGNWETLGKIGANIAEDVARMPQQMFGPSGEEAERLHQLYGTQPERYTPELDPIERSQADLAYLLYELAEPGPGGPGMAGIVGGAKATRKQLAEVLNVFRKNLKGPARRGVLERLERGLVLEDVPSRYVEPPAGSEPGTLADVAFDVPEAELKPLLQDLKRAGFMGDPQAAGQARRAETIMARQQRIDERLHGMFRVPGLPPPGRQLSRMRFGEAAGPSVKGHEAGHLVELGLAGQPQRQARQFAADLERPDILDPREGPVYWLEAVMAGERYPFGFAELKKMEGRGVKLTDELIEQAKLRQVLEQQGVNVKGLYNTVPRTDLMEGSPEFLRQLAAEEPAAARLARRPGVRATEKPMKEWPEYTEQATRRRTEEGRGFTTERYPTSVKVRVRMPDGDVFEDEIKGLNRGHALGRAKQNWPGATIEAVK